jgi:hypothetical protein
MREAHKERMENGRILLQQRAEEHRRDTEKHKQIREEHQRDTENHRQFMEEHRQFMEENKKRSELTKELIKKRSDQIKAFRKYAENEKVNKIIANYIPYLNNCLHILEHKEALPRNNLIKTVKEYISEIKIIEKMKLEVIDEKLKRWDILDKKIEKLHSKLLQTTTDTPASGGSKLPVKRRAKPKAKPKTNVVKPKAKPKPKPRSNKGVR